MKRYLTSLPLFIFLIALVASCSSSADNHTYTYVEEKIRGEWTVHKVALENNGRLFETDVTNKYSGMKFDFQGQNVLSIYDALEDKTYPGIWYLDESLNWDEDDQEYNSSFSLYTYFYNPDDTSQYREMTWNDLQIGRNRLNAKYKRYDDNNQMHKYTFKLRK